MRSQHHSKDCLEGYYEETGGDLLVLSSCAGLYQ